MPKAITVDDIQFMTLEEIMILEETLALIKKEREKLEGKPKKSKIRTVFCNSCLFSNCCTK